MSWWQETYKYARLLMTLVAKTDRHEADIKELRAENKKLSETVQQLIFERQRDRDQAEYARQLADKDRELLLPRLETKLLSYERRLPPPESSETAL